ADWIGAHFLTAANDTKDRSWEGTLNLYEVKQWVGSAGKASDKATDLKSWLKFWKNAETASHTRRAPFTGLKLLGDYSHKCSPQDWQREFPADADPILSRSRVGVNSYLAGPGQPFDQYRETIAYSDWLKGRLDLTAIDQPSPAKLLGMARFGASPRPPG